MTTSQTPVEQPSALSSPRPSLWTGTGTQRNKIVVRINYDIIRLFSEGLYKSPAKAVEELVSNGYDANAERVHIILPDDPGTGDACTSSLWVIDDGHGMDNVGFEQLWRIADSSKSGPTSASSDREPIGQFGIGKLAAYVLAWRLAHVSFANGRYLYTAMNFHDVSSHQNEPESPVSLALRELREEDAQLVLADIEREDPVAWEFLFGLSRSKHWTVAALSDFKTLYQRLQVGRLKWVLRTGLPLHSNFRICVNGDQLAPSRANLNPLKEIPLDHDLPGIGHVEGSARIYRQPLTVGKSGRVGRSHGYFVRVRRRVINLEDDLFGTTQPNHAAWHRFALEVDADGLRSHLLSSREGVRDSGDVQGLRDYLLSKFNECRQAYDEWCREQDETLDVAALLGKNPSVHVTEPLRQGVQHVLETGAESFYFDSPGQSALSDEKQREYVSRVDGEPIRRIEFKADGSNARSLRYEPIGRRLIVNTEHPFIDKLTASGKRLVVGELFGSAEIVLEGQLYNHGLTPNVVENVLSDRDRVLRVMAGRSLPTAPQISRLLDAAEDDFESLERAVGAAFHSLGFEYERRGGHRSGPDGSLTARLGVVGGRLEDYRVVYEAKQTDEGSVAAQKIDLARLDLFRREAKAEFGFFVAGAYEAQSNPEGALNRKFRESETRLTLLTVEHLRDLVKLHFEHGVTLVELRDMFSEKRTVYEVTEWIEALREKREHSEIVPVGSLLQWLEEEKRDHLSVPNLHAVRAKHSAELAKFTPALLEAKLRAVEQILGTEWVEVTEKGVVMHQTAAEIIGRLEKQVGHGGSGLGVETSG